MLQPLSKWETFKAKLAAWIVVQIAARISPLSVLALCKNVYEEYMNSIEEY